MKTEVAILRNEYPTDVREHVESKLQQLEKYNERTVSVRALLEKQPDSHRVELLANLRRGLVKVVDARGETFQATLDEAVHRMARVLSRHKDKMTDKSRARART